MFTQTQKLNGRTCEQIRVAGHLIRPAFRYVGGPVYGYVITRGRLFVALTHADVTGFSNHLASGGERFARASAVRIAKGTFTRRDVAHSCGWLGPKGKPRHARPQWLAFIRGVAVVGTYRSRGDCIAFHHRTGLKPRPLGYRCYR